MSLILGATYDESAVSPGRDRDMLEILSEAGFRSLELALHDNALNPERATALESVGRALGFSFAFHTPDFADPEAFDLNHIMAKSGSLKAFESWIDQCGALGDSVQLIFHGAASEYDTFRFIDWALNKIEKSRGTQILLLENTFAQASGVWRFGQSPETLLKALEAFSGCGQFGLCLDTAHWLRSQNHGQFPYSGELVCKSSPHPIGDQTKTLCIPEDLRPFIKRLHVHSVSPTTGKDHQGMTSRDEATAKLLSPWLKNSESTEADAPEACVVSVEVLASALEDQPWIEAVLESSAWMKTLTHKNKQHRPF